MPEPRRTKLTGVCPLSLSLPPPAQLPPVHLHATKSNPKFQEFRLLLNINCCICRRRLLDSVSLSFPLPPFLSLFLSLVGSVCPPAPAACTRTACGALPAELKNVDIDACRQFIENSPCDANQQIFPLSCHLCLSKT